MGNLALYKRFFLIISLLSFLICSSCDNKSIYSFDTDIQELIEWSKNNNSNQIIKQDYKPVSSQTLSEMVSIELGSENIYHNKGIIIGFLYINYDELFLNKGQKDLLALIAKAQKFEEFNILIESNNIKTIMHLVVDEVFDNLLSNGVKNNNINLNYLSNINKTLTIKIIKLL